MCSLRFFFFFFLGYTFSLLRHEFIDLTYIYIYIFISFKASSKFYSLSIPDICIILANNNRFIEIQR